MVLPAIAARAAAKGASKSAAKKATKTAVTKKTASTGARARKSGDDFYNARRRYQRSAERNIKRAENSSGATAARYRKLAKQDLDKALATYDKKTTQDYSKPIRNLANQLGVDLNQKRRQLQAMKNESAEKARESAKAGSRARLESAMQDLEKRRQAEARVIFNSDVGSRIIGGMVEVWQDVAIDELGNLDRKAMMDAIFDYLGVDNLADALTEIEKIVGDSLYSIEETSDVYEIVKLTIQNRVANNELVA